jgi:peroxiredoxin
MEMVESRPPVTSGEAAPNFTLPAVDGAGSISLSDYRGRSPVFLALMVGLWCPFCRRHIAQMGKTEDKLRAVGVETVGVVATAPDNARLYFKFRPTKLRLGSDPDLYTHRAYGLPRPVPNGEFMEAMTATRINPFGDLPAPLSIPEASHAITTMDKYEPTATDQAELERQFPQLKGQFLIDRDGIVRWANIECSEGINGVGKFPSDEVILAAAKGL